MSVTVKDIMDSPRFRHMKVLAGTAGMNNIVEYVDVLESPEGSKLLQPRDMVITTVYPLLNYPDEQRGLFKRMHELGVSVIAIKPKRFLDEIPDFMLEDADRYAIPIIELPPDAIFSEVISDVSRLVINEQAEILRQSLLIGESFFALGQSGGDLSEIAEALSQNTGRPVAILSDSFEMLNYACTDQKLKKNSADFFLEINCLSQLSPASLQRNKVNHYADSPSGRLFSIAPIVYAMQILGYVVLSEDKGFQELHDVALGYAATLAAFVIMAARAAREKESIIKYGILTDLVFNASYTQENVASWLNYFNLEIEHDYAVLVLREIATETSAKRGNRGLTTQVLLSLVEKVLQELFVVAQEDTIVILHSVADCRNIRGELQNQYQKLLAELDAYFEKQNYLICAGGVVHSILEVFHSYRQALQTAEIADKINIYNQICFYDDLDVHYIFNSYPDKKEIAKFVYKYLSPILDDHSCKFDALQTLETYLLTGSSVLQSARRLYIHTNTMKYRLSKIRELLDNPLTEPVYLHKLYMALTMYKLIDKPPAQKGLL